MQILPEYNKPYVIDSLDAPMVTRHNWTFDGAECDYMLSPIYYLEETTGEALRIRINNLEFWVPENWYILITDYDTYTLDTVPIKVCAKIKHSAVAFIPSENKLRTFDIEVLGSSEGKNVALVHPMINKGTALVHPVGPIRAGEKDEHASVIIGPYDLHKVMGHRTIGDLFF